MTDIAQYDLPPAALIEALASDAVTAQPRPLAQLRKQREKARSAFKEQSDRLDELYEKAAHSAAGASDLLQIAEVLLERERADAERLRPGMEALREKLARPGQVSDPETRELFQESLDIAVASLDLYRVYRKRLLALASDRKPGSKSILLARPVAGDIDYTELTREFIARFPKILAELAK
jgi:hypothetical protein